MLGGPENLKLFSEQTKQTLAALEPQAEWAVGLIAPIHPDDNPTKQAAQAFIQDGGKRLRPTLSLLTYAALTGQDVSTLDVQAVRPHWALELFHRGILVDDDVIDQDTVRNHNPTVHARLSQYSPRTQSARHFGESKARIASRLISAACSEVISRSIPTSETRELVRELFHRAENEVAWGWEDQFDMDYLPLDSPALTFNRIEDANILVSGRYSIWLPIAVGYALAGHTPPQGLQQFADLAGLVFQIGDDDIGIFGNTAKTGKSIDGDISQGKKTFLMHEGFRLADPVDRQMLQHHVGNTRLTVLGAQTVRACLVQTGARQSVKDLQHRYAEQGWQTLSDLPMPDRLRQLYGGMVRLFLDREQ